MTTVDLRQHYNAPLGIVGIGVAESANVESANLDHEQTSGPQLDRMTRGIKKQNVAGKIGLAAVRPDNAYLELTPGMAKLSPSALRDLATLASTFTKVVQSTEAKPTPELENRYNVFVETYVESGEVKIDNIMHYLQREAAIEKSKDLQSWAEKIKIFKEMREKARMEWSRARDVLSKVGGMPDSAVLDEPFSTSGEEFGAPDGPLSTEGGALIDIDGDGITDFIMPPELYDKHGVADAIEELTENAVVTTTTVTPEITTEVAEELVEGPTIDPFAVHTRCKGGKNTPNPSNLANSPHLKLAIYSILQESKKISLDEMARRLEAEYGIKATVTTVKSADGKTDHAALKFSDGSIFSDGNGDGMLAVADYNFKGAIAGVQEQFGITPQEFSALAPKYIDEMMNKMETAFAQGGKDMSQFPRDQLAQIFALAFVMSASEMILSKGDLEQYVRGLEAVMEELGKDSAVAANSIQQMMDQQRLDLLRASDLFNILNKKDDDAATEETPTEEVKEKSSTGETSQSTGGRSPIVQSTATAGGLV